MENDFNVTILAAGQSKRMKSRTNKVLHDLIGKPVIAHVVDTVRSLNPRRIFLVVSPDLDDIRTAVQGRDVRFVVQDEPLGTGDATLRVTSELKDPKGDMMVLPGDAPLLRPATAVAAMKFHRRNRSSATVITADHPNPGSYGRIVRLEHDELARIVEAKDATKAERAIPEINSGMYVFDARLLFESLPKVGRDNRQREQYLTDVIEILKRAGEPVHAFRIDDVQEILGINTRQELAQANQVLSDRLKKTWMERGVTFVDPALVYVEHGVKIGRDTVLFPFVSLLGRTSIGRGAVIGPNVSLTDARVGDGERVTCSKGVNHE
jgi:bifunctional UDP-N-acetylglucosamine pyrophosphorylase/glucosamine-1-phosphate N-acetyltransferase